MSQSTRFTRAAAAGSVLALAAGGALLASPANAATSATIQYTCTVLGGTQFLSGNHTVADTAPYGGDVDVSGTLVVPNALRDFLYQNGIRSVDGTTKVYALAAGAVPLTVDETVPKQNVPSTAGDWTINASGTLSLAPYAGATPAGTQLPVSLQDRKQSDGTTEASDLDATLQNYDANNAPLGGPQQIPCEIDPNDQVLTVGTVTVVAADSATAPKLSFNAKKDVLKAKSTVTSDNSHVTPDGKVKMVLKKDGKVVSTATKTLNDKGVASMSMSKAKNGNYKLIAKYLSDDAGNFNTSGGTATKKVS